MNCRRRLIQPIVLLALSFMFPTAVLAQDSQPTSKEIVWTLPVLVGSDTLRLEGYRPSAELTLTLPPGWEPVDDAQLALDYRISDLVLPEATLTVRLNDQTLHSIAFDETTGSIALDLLGEFFHPGRNVVELAAFLPLMEDGECIVPNHPARWLEIDSASQLSLRVETTEAPLTFADFPTPLEALGDDSAAQVTFVIPDNPQGDELNALSTVGFVLERGSTTHPKWSIVSASDFSPDTLSGPVVLLGATERISYLDALGPPTSEASGWLSVSRLEWAEGQPVLAVGGRDPQAALQAAEALADPLAALQLSGETAAINALPPRESNLLPEQFTLADLGYSDRTAQGSGEQSLLYTFDVPFDWSPQEGELELHFVQAATLNPEVASLTVFLNGRSLSGVRLDAPESASNVVEISIPQALVRPGRNFLRFTFNFGSPVELCGSDIGPEPWASVRRETTLVLPHASGGGRLDLGDFPYLFASEEDLAHLSIVLPAESTLSDFADALNVVRALSASDSRSAPRWIRAEALDETMMESHLVVLGMPSRQPLLTELNPHLPLPFDLTTEALLPNYGIRLPTDEPDLGVIQVLRSPWSENRAILIVSGTSSAGYSQALRILTDPLLQQELAGHLVIAPADGDVSAPRIYTQSFADIGAVPGVRTIDIIFGQLFGPGSPWPAIILVFGALLILALASILGLRWYRRNQASQPDVT